MQRKEILPDMCGQWDLIMKNKNSGCENLSERMDESNGRM